MGRPGDPAQYLGRVDDDFLRRAYSSCDVFVNWSAAEGFGLPVVEALACGCRVVVPPDNPTLIEVGGDQVAVADEPTPEGLARALVASAQAERKPVPDLSRFDWQESCRAIAAPLGMNARRSLAVVSSRAKPGNQNTARVTSP